MEQSLFDLILEFWLFWFPKSGLSVAMIVVNTWIAYSITVLIVVSVFIAPWFIIGRRKRKK